MYPSLKAENDALKEQVRRLTQALQAAYKAPEIVPEHACELGVTLREQWEKGYDEGGEANASTAEGAYVLTLLEERTKDLTQERDQYKRDFEILCSVVSGTIRRWRLIHGPNRPLYDELAADLHDDVTHALNGLKLGV
jgi:hypothetical protein